MTGTWVPHDTRDSIVDFVRYWSDAADLPVARFISWLHIQPSKYYNWKIRYGKANEHNGLVPRDFWLEAWERQAIIDYHYTFPDEAWVCGPWKHTSPQSLIGSCFAVMSKNGVCLHVSCPFFYWSYVENPCWLRDFEHFHKIPTVFSGLINLKKTVL